jgi:hypothetical protein
MYQEVNQEVVCLKANIDLLEEGEITGTLK